MTTTNKDTIPTDVIVARANKGKFWGITDAARAAGLPVGTVASRIAAGKTLEEAIGMGEAYERRVDVIEAAEKSGIRVTKLAARMRRGATLEEAVKRG